MYSTSQAVDAISASPASTCVVPRLHDKQIRSTHLRDKMTAVLLSIALLEICEEERETERKRCREGESERRNEGDSMLSSRLANYLSKIR